ncbi:DUF6053 domain-containing protein [Lysobacter enzymogenes]|uniref:DUF6053 domain-containing protein n=1 Tax=Lysobacter enzymogenes TaxID=69 RepID=UPI003D18C4F4
MEIRVRAVRRAVVFALGPGCVFAATGAESVGPEGPPTRAAAAASPALSWEGLQARRFALRSP